MSQNSSSEILCPECGGSIGGMSDSQAGKQCTCFAAASPSDTDVLEPTVQQPKICVVCAQDTAGRRRLKDSRGYICYECAKEERRKERGAIAKPSSGPTIRCEDCLRRVRESAVTDYMGMKLCDVCAVQRKEAEKRVPKKVASAAFANQEKKNLYVLLAVFAFLGLLVLLSHLGIIGHA